MHIADEYDERKQREFFKSDSTRRRALAVVIVATPAEAAAITLPVDDILYSNRMHNCSYKKMLW